MSYYLSDSDVKVLKQTINTVNNLPVSLGGKSRPTIKHAFAYVELTEQNEDGLWSAKEVYFDETGTPSELVGGRTWGADSVYIIVNGTVSVGQVVRVEAYYMVDSSSAEQAVWVGSAIGGGGITYGVVSSVSEDLADHYNITLYDSRTSINNADPNNTVILNMTSLSNYGLLPTNFVLAVNELEDGTYEPFEIQSTCFGVIVSRNGIDSEHPNDNYTVTVNTAPYGEGMTLGDVNATVPNVDYGYMSTGAKQTVFFVKENNAWYMNPATFGAY